MFNFISPGNGQLMSLVDSAVAKEIEDLDQIFVSQWLELVAQADKKLRTIYADQLADISANHSKYLLCHITNTDFKDGSFYFRETFWIVKNDELKVRGNEGALQKPLDPTKSVTCSLVARIADMEQHV